MALELPKVEELSAAALELPAGGMLPVEVLNEIANATWGALLVRAGFTAVKPRLWVRSRLEFARDVFELSAVKGAAYVPRCGLSLNFVPHVQSGVLRWHRTAKSALVDLDLPLREPQEARGAKDAPSFPADLRLTTPSLLGTAKFNQELAQRRAPFDTAEAEAELGRVTNLAQLAEALERRIATSSLYGSMQHPLALAFTLARLGRMSEARLALAISSHMTLDSLAQRLSQELERVSSLSSPARTT